ncbi:MAG: DMT family transporter, partial [Ardenticatenaceae bacterium]
GVVLATMGLALLTLELSAELALAAGDLWVMACAAGFALHIIAISRYAPRYPVLPFTLVQLGTVAILASLAALFLERGALVPPPNSVPAILYMGLVATALVFGLQTWVQRFTTPTHTALIFALEPVFAALFAILVAGEILRGREWLGGVMILLGMVVAEVGDKLWKKRGPPAALAPQTDP